MSILGNPLVLGSRPLVIRPLAVSANGVYTAPDNTAYTPVTVDVPSASGAGYIYVAAPTGSTVTAAKDGNAYTAAESTTAPGTWEIPVPEYGTYTVTATRGQDSGSKTVTVPMPQTAFAFSLSGEIANGLICELMFEDLNGSTTPDTSGNGVNGTIGGTVNQIIGKAGFAAQSVSGSSGSISIPCDCTTATLSFWLRSDYASNPGSDHRAISFNSNYYYTSVGVSSGGMLAVDAGNWTCTIGLSVTDNTWHHIVITLQPDTSAHGIWNVYVDGVKQPDAQYGWYGAGGSSITLLNYNNWSVDQFRLWERVLTTDEIAALYNNGDGI